VAGAPCGPRRGPPANLTPDLKSMDRNVEKLTRSPSGDQGEDYPRNDDNFALDAVARSVIAEALTGLIFALHTAWCM
jgi:hypothetical protein